MMAYARIYLPIILALYSGVAMAAPLKRLSLDICADYYLASFVGSEGVMFTRQAKDGFSLPMTIPTDSLSHNGSLEEVIAYAPEQILTSMLSFGDLPQKLQKYPYPTVHIPWATNLVELKTLHNRLDEVLKTKKGQKLNAKIDEILQNIPPKTDKNMLILAPNGFTIKQGTHYDIIFDILGINNYHTGNGYGMIGIEEILTNPPDMIVTINRSPNRPQLGDSLLQHKALKQLGVPIYDISELFTICPSMELIGAAEKLREMMPW